MGRESHERWTVARSEESCLANCDLVLSIFVAAWQTGRLGVAKGAFDVFRTRRYIVRSFLWTGLKMWSDMFLLRKLEGCQAWSRKFKRRGSIDEFYLMTAMSTWFAAQDRRQSWSTQIPYCGGWIPIWPMRWRPWKCMRGNHGHVLNAKRAGGIFKQNLVPGQ